MKNYLFKTDYNFAAPWSWRYKKDAGDQRIWLKIRRNPPQPILDGIEREKSLAIKFDVIIETPDFWTFSIESAVLRRSLAGTKYQVSTASQLSQALTCGSCRNRLDCGENSGDDTGR